MRFQLVPRAVLVFATLPLFAGVTFTMPDAPATLRADGNRILLLRGETVVASAPATAGRITVIGAPDRDDTLTIDLDRPLDLPGGIDYDGGARGFDVLALRGGATREQRTTQLTPHDGTIQLDALMIRYRNLEPITDTAPAAIFVINGTAGLDTVTVTDGPGGTTTVSSQTFESVTFANKTSVTYDGLGGGDTVQFNNPTPATGLQSFIVTNVATVTQTGVLRYPSFAASTSGDISLFNFANDVDRVELAATSGSIFFADSDTLTVGGVTPLLTGITTTMSQARLGAGTSIVVEENIDADVLTLRTSELSIDPAATITVASGPTFIETFGLATNFDLGSTGDVSPTALELSDAELDRIVTDVIILETFTGIITVTQPITYATDLILRTPNWFTATGTGSLTATSLSFEHTFNSPKTWTITPTTIQISGGAPVPYTATRLDALGHFGSVISPGGGNDTFLVTPSATTTMYIDGNLPTPPASPGDTLDFDLTGVVAPVYTATLGPNGYTGTLTSANRQPVNFFDIETIIDAPVDLAVEKTDNATTAVAGMTIDYRVTVTNNSALTVSGVTVVDNFPPDLTNVQWICNGAGATCTGSGTGNINDTVTLLPGGLANYLITATIAASMPPGTLTNTATVTATGYTETNPTNNTATDTTAIVAEANLVLTKSTSSTPVAGGDITYTITLRNAGPSDAQDVVLTDVLPAGTSFVSLAAPPGYTCTTGATVTCSIDPLAPSATADTFTLVVRVNPGTPAGTAIVNNVSATSPTDTTPGTGTATIVVGAAPAGIPTLSEWMLLALAALLAFVALRATRVLD